MDTKTIREGKKDPISHRHCHLIMQKFKTTWSKKLLRHVCAPKTPFRNVSTDFKNVGVVIRATKQHLVYEGAQEVLTE